MSTTDLGRFDARSTTRTAAPANVSLADTLRVIFAPLASLKLTVSLLGLSIVLVLAGTLAQVDHDILFVLNNYFRTWIAWFELRIFFPRDWNIDATRVFPFPGGKLLGLALAINLVAAHAVRFKVAAKGKRLWLGWLTIALGAAITYGVIVSGANTTVESELTPSFTNGLWHVLRAALGGAALTLVYVLALTRVKARKSAAWWLWLFGAATAVLLAGLAVYLFTHPDARLDASGLRILWQLAKATAASLVLGAGCWAVFNKRAGIVLLHSGIGLMMFTELYTAQNVVESRMNITEGQTAYFAEDIRTVELAFTDAADPNVDHVVAIPARMLVAAAKSGETIHHADLPFDVRVTRFLPNARARRVQPGETATATAGIGQLYTVDALPETSGVANVQTVDMPSAYIELLEKNTTGDSASRGIYLASLQLKSEALDAAGKKYQMDLRFKRIPKPYEVQLLDFKFERYVASETAKNYESIVQFRDAANNVDHRVSIRMNNPLRYGGDTLYQASFDETTERTTVLQVMTNSGWMVPYVACMIVAAGMLVHFTQGIVRFVLRREDEVRRAVASDGESALAADYIPWTSRWHHAEYWVPALIVLLAAFTTLRFARPPESRPLEVKIYEFGNLPVAFGGRTQPMDSIAQNTLRVVSGKATYDDTRFEKPQPAIRWMLDVIAQAPAFTEHRVIRIENLDVLESLGLPQRPGVWRYSLSEIYKDVTETNDGEFERQVALARAVPEKKRDLAQQKILEASTKVSRVMTLRQAFNIPNIGERGELLFTNQADFEKIIAQLRNVAPKAVPPATPDDQWLTVYESMYNAFRQLATTGRADAADERGTRELLQMLAAYREGESVQFNARLADYRNLINQTAAAEAESEAALAAAGEPNHRKPAERLVLDRIAFESFFNHFSPFIICLVFYVAAFVLAALSWVGWPRVLNRAANWLLWFTFGLHTFGLICRIYISGRPPVTNLYSSALFIAWAGVLFFLLLEIIYKVGLGNLLAAVLGVPTMFIAYYLTFEHDGDTLGVMQAVLDTNFWLGTHVVCIALGYQATLAAGAAGLLTLLLGSIGGVLDENLRRQLTRMTYGALCFAIFFSFIGTILGGLWADDSWGRFWGWDPKENGALMIVIWNAIVLHARWGKMVGERGLAALAVLGNIVVAWSWWGVNQLSIGLHNYGWTEGLTFWLVLFDALMLAVVATAYLMPFVKSAAPQPPAAAA